MTPWYALYWLTPHTLRSFHYDQPWALWLVPLAVGLFGVRRWLGRRYHQQLRVSLAGLAGPRLGLRTRLIGSLRYLMPLCSWLGISFLLVAMARPQVVRQLREEQSVGIDIVLAIDISSSMTETDLRPNRLAAARLVAQRFVSGRRNDRIGLVVFAGEAFSLCPLTTDYALLQQYIREMSPAMIRTTGTAIGDALARGINRLRDSPTKSKVLILLSDGDNTAGNLDPLTVARLAPTFGIRIYTIAAGKRTQPTDTLGIATQFDEGILKTIASVGQGSFFRAGDAGQLRQVFARIDRLERAPVRVQTYEDVQDQYRPYLYWGTFSLLLVLLLKNTVFGNSLED